MSIEEIVSDIVKLSLEKGTDDNVRDLYSVLIDIDLEVGKIMKLIRDQERR